ncbi:P-loop containing nucleoside triphosphate hydrolase protein, partial [Dendrothele bispora CBS 962.96]
ATPRPPALLFALASDNPDEVRRVLENDGNNNDTTTANAGSDQSTVDANGTIGPNAQSALEFTLTNEGLKNKLDIVKVLLGYGADPAKAGLGPQGQTDGQDVKSTIEMDDATRYYISRADAQLTRRTAALMQRSVFRPLARARYRLVGQDRALEQLFRMLSMYSEKISSNPVVVFLCGPSGHGKSLLAHQFGSLLDIPTHTVNMTTLRSADDLWRSYSISSSDDSTPCTLVEFLANNEGKRCVVVLDEIEKTADLKALWTLLVPWELGRCTFEANSRTIDVKNVVWVGTSNVGHDLVFEHHQSRANQEEIMSREEYVDLMGIVRSRVSDELGASILSRVSAILPFVPFISEEKKAMASEFLQHQCIAAGLDEFLTKEKREKIIDDAMGQYVPSEGARSLYRAVSNLLVDSIDF